jgi:DNA adenine methylase
MRKDPLIKPYLKWAGGKRQLLPEIKTQLPKDFETLRYFEPFIGAGAMFFDQQPERAVINDNNKDLIQTYLVIKNHINELIEALTAHKEQHNKEYYYQVREQDREAYAALTDVQKAARLIYLNKTCYNGLYRVNSHGFFNVPYGRYKHPAICDGSVLMAINGYFNRKNVDVEILDGDFAAAVEKAGRGSFVYFDPPYHSPDKKKFTEYQSGGFDNEEQKRLRDVFAERTRAGAKCLLSNSDTPFIRDLYNDNQFEIIPVKAKRAINSVAMERGEVNEVLIKNWKQ